MSTCPTAHPSSSYSRGESLIELLLAIAIFSAVLPTILYAIGSVSQTEPQKTSYFNATVLTEETKNILQQIKFQNWNDIATNGTYILTQSSPGSPWTLGALPNPIPTIGQGLMRTITISDIYRNAQKKIVSSGGTIDTATKKITISFTWVGGQTPLNAVLYVSRHDQTDLVYLRDVADFDGGGGIHNGTFVITPTGVSTEGNVSITSQTPAKPSGSASPVSWWDMNSTIGSSPSWIIDNNSTTSNTATYFPVGPTPVLVSSRYDKAIRLDGSSQYLLIPATASTDVGSSSTGLTIEMMVKPTTTATMPWVEWNNSGESGLTTSSISGSPLAHFFSNTIDTTSTAHNLTSSGQITAGKWNHLTYVYDKSTGIVRHYLNGVAISGSSLSIGSVTAQTTHLSNPAYAILVGHHAVPSPTPPSYFTGDIDDVAIYNTALTESQVFDISNASYTSSPRDMGSTRQFYNFSAVVYQQPPDTQVKLRIGLANLVSGACPTLGADYTFVGPLGDQSANDYYSSLDTGQATVGGAIPSVASPAGTYANPAQCLRVKAYFFSRNVYDAATLQTTGPVLKSVKIMYAL